MLAALEARRVLLAVEPGLAASLRDLFGQGIFTGWEWLQADNREQTRFILQHQPCHVLLADETVVPDRGFQEEGEGGNPFPIPMLLLVGRDLPAGEQGSARAGRSWLPAELALKYPVLLAGALNQAAELTELRRHTGHARQALKHSRRQVDQLVNILWRALPADMENPWLSQRHLLERLREETHRAVRYGDALTLVLGEIEAETVETMPPLQDWLVDRIVHTKRSSDLAGQYGLRGFLLLLVNTDEAGGLAYCRRLAQTLGQPAGPYAPFLKAGQWSFGIASLPSAAVTGTDLLSHAEQRLEAAKTTGWGLEAGV